MIDHNKLTKQFKVIIPDNWSKKQKGDFLENLIADLFRHQRWQVKQRISFTGMEIDILAENPDTYDKAIIECKFHKESLGSDIVRQLMGNAQDLEVQYAYLVSTSELGQDARGMVHRREQKNKEGSEPYKLVYWGPEKLAEVFMQIKGIELPDLDNTNFASVKVITLLLTHKQTLWVAEEIEEGEPCKAILYPTSSKDKINIEELSAEFSKLNLWQGLEIIDGTKINSQIDRQVYSVSALDREVVSPIGMAESFDDYRRPCRPQDFVGRSNLREKFWDFLQAVREGQTLTRIVCFSGSSGLGKSSLVLRLAEDCLEKRKKNNFYLYHVDVRSARSAKAALFVGSAIRAAIQKAINDGFIELLEHQILMESTEQPFFSSQSIKIALEKLKLTGRVLIIFFDQFEELFTKESLFSVYELFEKAAHEVDALKENIVLGFCWRTGISMPDDHKAYYLWHGLTDKRLEFDVKDFIEEESETFLKQFDRHLTKRRRSLDKKLKKWLLDRCPGFPWLLKKICSDIFNQILSESEIVPGRQVDIKGLFDKDLQDINATENDCIKYIAKQSPVAINEVSEKFGDSVIQYLETKRLVRRIGQNYTLYWDIFREYVLEGKVPQIPLNYRPRNTIHKALTAFKLISQEKEKGINLSGLIEQTHKNKGTLQNILWDLQNFFFVIRQDDLIVAQESLVNLSDDELADYLAKQLEEHIVMIEVYKQLKPGKMMTLWGFHELLANAYGLEAYDNKTIRDYASRLLSWILFTGLLEKQNNKLIIRPIGKGKQKGKSLECIVSGSAEDTDLPLLKLLN